MVKNSIVVVLAQCLLASQTSDVDEERATVRAALEWYATSIQSMEAHYRLIYDRKDVNRIETQEYAFAMKGTKLFQEQLSLADQYERFFWAFDGKRTLSVTAIKNMPVNVNIRDVPPTFYSTISPLTFAGMYLTVAQPTTLYGILKGESECKLERIKRQPRDLLRVKIPFTYPGENDPESLFEYLLDPAQQYLPKQIALYSLSDKAVEPVPVWSWQITEHQQIKDETEERWFPSKAVSRRADGGVNTFELVSVKMNDTLPDSRFTYDVPEGADVFDLVNNRVYIQGGLETRERSLNATAQLAMEKGIMIPARRRSYLGWMSAALGLSCGVILVLLGWQRLKRRA